MTVALDDMVGELLDYLDTSGTSENTLVVFTSDHGSQFGVHGIDPWKKKQPYRELVHVPCVVRNAFGSSSTPEGSRIGHC